MRLATLKSVHFPTAGCCLRTVSAKSCSSQANLSNPSVSDARSSRIAGEAQPRTADASTRRVGKLQLAAAKAFPEFPAEAWMHSTYIWPNKSGVASGRKMPAYCPEPNVDPIHLEAKSSLSPYQPPAPGQDIPTVNLDREAFRTVRSIERARKILHLHLLSCLTVTDVLRVAALAMQRRLTARALADTHARIIQVMYRARVRASDQRICSGIRMLITRLEMARLPVSVELYACGLRFAGRSREVAKMRWFLVRMRALNVPMRPALFRAAVAKCGIGTSPLGEIRNGRWDRAALRQVLFGFDSPRSVDEAHAHLETWLDRGDFRSLHAWMQLLLVVGAREHAEREWRRWQASEDRRKFKLWHTPKFPPPQTTASRHDCLFLCTLLQLGDTDAARQILAENPSVWKLLDQRMRNMLLGSDKESRSPLEQSLSPQDEHREAIYQVSAA